MGVSIHLFDDDRRDAAQLVTPADDRWTKEPAVDPGYPCLAVGAFRSRSRPDWAAQFEDHFDIEWRASVGTSAALLASVADRWFAVTFGHGRHLLRPELLVPDFGLRVTANAVPPDRFRSVATLRLDGSGRRTRQSVAIPSGLRTFDVDVHGEWLRSLGGATDEDLMRGMTGSQALSVDLGPEQRLVKILPELCGRLLEHYRATRYRAVFPYLDLIRPLHGADQRIAELETRLVGRFLDRRPEIGVLVPDPQPGDEVPARFTVGRHHLPLTEHTARAAVRRGGVRGLDQQVRAWTHDGATVGPVLRLRECLSAEVELQGGLFVLAEGRWFDVDRERNAELDRELDGIPHLDGTWLDLPHWRRGAEDETAYNARAAASLGLEQVHGELFSGPDPRDRIEVCDLLAPGPDLVCVKKLDGARSMSHLFSQGSVSARLYHGNRAFRRHVDDRHANRWPGADRDRPRIVYAIGTVRSGPLRTVLPLFSRINLVNQARTVRRAGLDVAATWIRMVDPPIVAVPPAPPPGGAAAEQLGLDYG